MEADTKASLQNLFGKSLYNSLLIILDGVSSSFPQLIDSCKSWLASIILKVDGSYRSKALNLVRYVFECLVLCRVVQTLYTVVQSFQF